MNSVLNFFGRQHGNGLSAPYDLALTRLSVGKRDSWTEIISISPLYFSSLRTVRAAKFAKCEGMEHILAIGNDHFRGHVALLDTDLRNNNQEGERRLLLGKHCHGRGVFDIDWMPGHMKLVSGSADRTVLLFTVTESSLRPIRVYAGHTKEVKTVAFRRTDPAVFASGGRDGVIAVWDSRASSTSKPENFIDGGHFETPSEFWKGLNISDRTTSCGITGLAFQDDNTLISCGAADGFVKMWDVRRHYSSHDRDPLPKHSLPYAGRSSCKGFTNLLIDHSRNRLYVNCKDNHIYCYDISGYSAEPIQRYGGLKNKSLIKSCLSPDGQYLLSGSGDSNSYIWNVGNPNPLVRLEGRKVSAVAWTQSRNDIRIVTCNAEQWDATYGCSGKLNIWRVGLEEIDEDTKEHYNGHAKYCDSYWQKSGKVQLKSQLPSSSQFSPTVNLPNFVLDGEAPHLVNVVTNNGNKRTLRSCSNSKQRNPNPSKKRTPPTEPQRSLRSRSTGGQSRTLRSSRP